ncbi:uncharacterized protein LOC143278477 [Babylonia areolata]|uniref:uncharacterized protein LOC143278477 n=1 Tax=Babylonia areolata TaxID=304850 RepID=UPI003FD63191
MRVGPTLSDIYEQELGVLKRSILSPVLFSIKINNIVHPPWTFTTPEVRFDLASYRKDTTSSLAYRTYFSELCHKFPTFQGIFTDGSKSEDGVAASAFCPAFPDRPSTEHILSDSSVYTAELTALVLGLKMVLSSKQKRFMIFSDSLSALEAIACRNITHPKLLEFYETFTLATKKGYEVVLAWVPGHVGIRGNERADLLARNAVKKELSRSLVPYTDMKRKVNTYVKDLWQEKWNTQMDNKLFQIRPDLGETLPSGVKNRKEESVLCRLRTGHTFFYSFLLVEGGGGPSMRSL